MKDTLYYGDNINILRDYIPDESVDLIYLDPPFNSKRTYNVLFKHESGQDSEAQIAAFDDTWHWDISTERVYREIVLDAADKITKIIASLRDVLGTNQMMAYLVMMTARLIELHRVLKPAGSIYLHCDDVANHYLRMIMDAIFGIEHYKNQIVWQRTNAHNTANRYGRNHDIILFYTKSETFTWNNPTSAYSVQQLKRYKEDEDGRLYTGQDLTASRPNSNSGKFEWRGTMPPSNRGWGYTVEQLDAWWEAGLILIKKDGTPRLDGRKVFLDEMQGKPLQSLWTDIQRIPNTSAERLGYPTQKPVELLKRILEASSNEGDVVLDPFCGCGTTIAAAQELGRTWLGIDITFLATSLIKYRLKDSFPDIKYEVVGEPTTLDEARHLAEQDRFQFEWWALPLVGARPIAGKTGSKWGKKGADKGIDGFINFIDDSSNKPKRIIVQVKSGKVGSRDVRDLVGTIDREKAAIGILITLQNPTKPMQTEADSARLYYSPGWNTDYPRIQIMTVEQLLDGAQPQMPPTGITFAQAPKVKQNGGKQEQINL